MRAYGGHSLFKLHILHWAPIDSWPSHETVFSSLESAQSPKLSFQTILNCYPRLYILIIYNGTEYTSAFQMRGIWAQRGKPGPKTDRTWEGNRQTLPRVQDLWWVSKTWMVLTLHLRWLTPPPHSGSTLHFLPSLVSLTSWISPETQTSLSQLPEMASDWDSKF